MVRLKKKLLLSFIFITTLTISTNVYARSKTYKIDPAHAYIGFSVRHMMASEVKGSFRDFEGTINYDPENIAATKVDVVIQAASIDTNIEDRDEHLRKEDFLDVKKYPIISFKADSVEQRNNVNYLVGYLTLKNAAKPVEMACEIVGPVNNPAGSELIGLTGSAIINRQEYGLTFNRPLDSGGLVVGNMVKIDFSIEAVAK